MVSSHHLAAEAGDTGMLFIKSRRSCASQGPIITR